MEGAATPHFLWTVLTRGHQRKAVMDTWSAIRTSAKLGEQTKRVFFFFFFFTSHNLRAAQGSYRKHPCSPVSQARRHSLGFHRGLGLLSQFLGMMDYFLCLLLLSPAMHLCRHSDLANMNVYVYIYGFRYKNE